MAQTHRPDSVLDGEINPSNWVPIKEEPLYSTRKIKLICAGAGVSGLTLAFKIKHECKLEDYIDLVVYEKNPDIGGTWFENRYPGVACDIPAHAYNFYFEPNPDWSHFYAPGDEIQRYVKRAVAKWNLDERVQLNSKITEAVWDEETGKWHVTIDQAGTLKHETCDIFVNSCGFLNKWKWPEIEGLSKFKGTLAHSANWDSSCDWDGKRVAVIGNGSSGIQATTAMAAKASRLINYVRRPTWISINFLAEHTKDGHNFAYTEEEKKRFTEEPAVFYEHRKKIEASVNQFFFAMMKGHPASQGLTAICKAQMTERLGPDLDLAGKLIPDFHPGCRRLTPGDGYIEAFKQDHVDMCWNPILEITEKGIRTESGEDEFDIILCATGFDTSFIPPFKLVGRDDTSLEKKWAKDPYAFFSVQVDGMPNYFMLNGPNCVISHGSVLTQIAFTCDYILRWVKKIATEDIKSMDVKQESVADFNVYSQEFLKRMAWSDKCRSWYKNGKESGAVTGPYGGSFLHYITCLQNIGAEHFNFTYHSVNRFRFLGNGQAIGENNGAGDMAYYMDDYEELRKQLDSKLKGLA